MSELQQQAQEKDAEVCRQQRELQALRVRTHCYKLTLVTFVVMTASGTQVQKDEQLAEIQQQLRERDAEINRLQRQLRVRN